MELFEGGRRTGVLTKALELREDKGGIRVERIFDTGAPYSFIRRDIAEILATLIPLDEPLSFEVAEEGCSVMSGIVWP